VAVFNARGAWSGNLSKWPIPSRQGASSARTKLRKRARLGSIPARTRMQLALIGPAG